MTDFSWFKIATRQKHAKFLFTIHTNARARAQFDRSLDNLILSGVWRFAPCEPVRWTDTRDGRVCSIYPSARRVDSAAVGAKRCDL